MPREVIHVQVGQCGNQIGTKFWQTIAQEHGLSPDGSYVGKNSEQREKIDVYYHETFAERYVPRACLVDMEKSVLNHIQQRTYGDMFNPDNILTGDSGAANNFYEGYYSDTANALCKNVINCLRSEVERTQCFQGFTFSHSSAGGTGSGVALRIFDKANDLFNLSGVNGAGPGNYFFTIFPSNQVSNTVLEPYNSARVIEGLKAAQNVVCFDNEALYNICFNTLGLKSPTFADMNRLVSMVMSGNTASFRFSGQVNTDMNKLSYGLRVVNGMHWYVPSFAPLFSLNTMKYRKVTVDELVAQMTQEENQMFQSTPDKNLEPLEVERIDGSCFAYAALFRGNMSSQDVDEALAFLKGDQELENSLRNTIGYDTRKNLVLEPVKKTQRYFKRNPRPTFNAITNSAAPGFNMSVTYLRNTTQVKFKFLSILQQAMKMHVTSSYSHWLDNNGQAVDGATEMETKLESLNELVSNLGVADTTEFPAVQTYEEICQIMKGEASDTKGSGKPASKPAAAPAAAPTS